MYLNKTKELAYHESIQIIKENTFFVIACSIFVQVAREIVNNPLDHEAINIWLDRNSSVTPQNTHVQDVF